MMAQATILIGIYGVGIFNHVWMSPGATVIEILNFGMPRSFNNEYRNSVTASQQFLLELRNMRGRPGFDVAFRYISERSNFLHAISQEGAAIYKQSDVVFDIRQFDELVKTKDGKATSQAQFSALKMAHQHVNISALADCITAAFSLGINRALLKPEHKEKLLDLRGAVAAENDEIVRLMLASGTNPYRKHSDGKAAIDIAREMMRSDYVKLLVNSALYVSVPAWFSADEFALYLIASVSCLCSVALTVNQPRKKLKTYTISDVTRTNNSVEKGSTQLSLADVPAAENEP